MLPEGLQDGGGVNDDDAISMCSSFNSDASSNAALEGWMNPDWPALQQCCTAKHAECTRPQMQTAQTAPDPPETDTNLAPIDVFKSATLAMHLLPCPLAVLSPPQKNKKHQRPPQARVVLADAPPATDQVADRILRAMVADATWDDESELDADDYVATCFEFQHVRRLSVAFAMGQHLRLGEQSTVQCLEQGVVKDIVFMVLSSVSREW